MSEHAAPLTQEPTDDERVPRAVRTALRVLTRLARLLAVITLVLIVSALVVGLTADDVQDRVGFVLLVVVVTACLPVGLTILTAWMAPAARAGRGWPLVVLVVLVAVGALPTIGSAAAAVVWGTTRPGGWTGVSAGGAAAALLLGVLPTVVPVVKVRAAVLLSRRPARAWAAEQRAAHRR